jgi:hypothetical protein
MEDFLIYSGLAYIGTVLHLLKKLNEAKRKNGYTLGGFIQDQVITTIGTIIAVPLTIYLIYDNLALQELLPLTSLTSVGIGYVGQSVILSILDGKFRKNEKSRPVSGDIHDSSI